MLPGNGSDIGNSGVWVYDYKKRPAMISMTMYLWNHYIASVYGDVGTQFLLRLLVESKINHYCHL